MIKKIIIDKIEDLKLLLDKDVVAFETRWPTSDILLRVPNICETKIVLNNKYKVPEDVYTSCLTCLSIGGTIVVEKEVIHNYE